MKRLILLAILLTPLSSPAQDWVKVTDKAGWQPVCPEKPLVRIINALREIDVRRSLICVNLRDDWLDICWFLIVCSLFVPEGLLRVARQELPGNCYVPNASRRDARTLV